MNGKNLNFAKPYGVRTKVPYVPWRTRFWDWLWYRVGMRFWKNSARNHPEAEVKRRLNWMTLDCRENDARWRSSEEGRAFFQARKLEDKLTFSQRFGSSAKKL